MDKIIHKFKWKDKGTRIVKTILKENRVRGISQLNYKTCYKAKLIKTVWCQGRDRHIDLRTDYRFGNRRENPEIDQHEYAQLTSDKSAKAIQ